MSVCIKFQNTFNKFIEKKIFFCISKKSWITFITQSLNGKNNSTRLCATKKQSIQTNTYVKTTTAKTKVNKFNYPVRNATIAAITTTYLIKRIKLPSNQLNWNEVNWNNFEVYFVRGKSKNIKFRCFYKKIFKFFLCILFRT